jgi:hypothetical protein
MKLFIIIITSLILICMTATAFGQEVCQFNVVGTWKASTSNDVSSSIYRFEPDGTVTILSLPGSGNDSKSNEVARGTYKLDKAKSPTSITFTITREREGSAQRIVTAPIVKYDDSSFTSGSTDYDTLHWVRMDPNQYFLVLAGRNGVFYDRSGPTFPILIKTDGREKQIDAVGIYFAGGRTFFGAVPDDLRDELMKESAAASDVMLRLKITAPQYERELKILRTWDRRAKEGNLLYQDIFMDNVLLVKQVTETLNQCGDAIKLYNLDWGIYDYITENNSPSLAPFLYFKELKRLNASLHIPDAKFHESMRPAAASARR